MSDREDTTGTKRGPAREPDENPIRVHDRRHWAQPEGSDDGAEESAEVETADMQALRLRAEEAERKLVEVVSAFRQAQAEQEQFRERMTRDIDRRVQLAFGNLVADLVGGLDDLDLALAHAAETPGAEALAHGVTLARNGFVSALEKAGVERIDPTGEPFDPVVAEAMRLAPVDTPELDGMVVETLRPGYRLGDRVIRPARVAVGRHAAS